MVLIAIIALLAGVLCGMFLFEQELVSLFSYIADYALYLLMFAVGISVGMNKRVFQKIKEYHIRIFIIPIGIVTASVLGGFLCGLLLQMPYADSVSVASGLGWYSLSGVLLTDLAGPEVGTIAFLSNLMREVFSFLLIPFIAKYLNAYTAIAPAGATSEDTTLPMLIKYTSEEVVVMAVFNGVICSALAPVLIKLFHAVL